MQTQTLVDEYRTMYFLISMCEGGAGPAAKSTLLNAVTKYESVMGRSGTLNGLSSLQTFLLWTAAAKGHPASVPSYVSTLRHLGDGVVRPWLADEQLKRLQKAIQKAYGQAPETAMEMTVEIFKMCRELIHMAAVNKGVQRRTLALLFLTFLAGFRIGQAVGDLHGQKAPLVFWNEIMAIFELEDGKVLSSRASTSVAAETRSGFRIGDVMQDLADECGMVVEDTDMTLKGKVVKGKFINYYVARLWLTPGGDKASEEDDIEWIKMMLVE
jgi:hypothetical protein